MSLKKRVISFAKRLKLRKIIDRGLQLRIVGYFSFLLWPSKREAYYQRKLGESKLTIKQLKKELRKVPYYEYGSYVRGRADWAEKWKNAAPGHRVLMHTHKDFGSMYRWAEAVNRHTDYAVRLVAFKLHDFDFPTDLVLPVPGISERKGLEEITAEADIIHFKDEIGFFNGFNGVPFTFYKALKKPLIYTTYGGQMRKWGNDAQYRAHVLSYDAHIALTPDLNPEWLNAQIVPQTIDTHLYPFTWSDGRLLAHSPSTQLRKGTPDLLEAVKGMDIEFDLIHGVSFEECLARKRRANLFFDQAGREIPEWLGIDTVIGWYGNAAIEAAVFGIPTIAHLSETAFEGSIRAGYDLRQDCGILNTPIGAEGIRQTIQNFFDATLAEREAIARKTRKWVEDYHSYEACAKALTNVYDRFNAA